VKQWPNCSPLTVNVFRKPKRAFGSERGQVAYLSAVGILSVSHLELEVLQENDWCEEDIMREYNRGGLSHKICQLYISNDAQSQIQKWFTIYPQMPLLGRRKRAFSTGASTPESV
jgi:hypothetical protein